MNIQSNLNPPHGVAPEAPVARTAAGANAPAPGAKAPEAASRVDGDTANLSHAARSVAASSSGDDVRAEKVAAVQHALANGSYAVSPSDVAGKLIDHLLQN